MLKRFFDFLRDLFGGGATEAQPAPAQAEPSSPMPPVEEPPAQVHEEEAETEAATSLPGIDLQLTLAREGSTSYGTPGTLSMDGKHLADTLEGSGTPNELDQVLIAPGTYPVTLWTEGGKHATYLYRFGDRHKGLLAVQHAELTFLPTLHIGYKALHLHGSIILGKKAASQPSEGDRELRLTESEETYQSVYQLISEAIEKGKAVGLTIRA